MGKFNEYKWSILALGLILGSLLLSQGGLASLKPLVRFLLPALLVIMVFKMLQKRLMGGAAMASLKKKMEEAMQQAQAQQSGRGAGPGGNGKVIDLCPKCGTYLAPGHRCAKKS